MTTTSSTPSRASTGQLVGPVVPEMTCSCCAADLPRSGSSDFMSENSLHLTLDGGYGGFIDTGEAIGEPVLKYVLCHDCAVRLGQLFGLAAVLDAHANSNVPCSCPDYPARQARFEALIAQQRAD